MHAHTITCAYRLARGLHRSLLAAPAFGLQTPAFLNRSESQILHWGLAMGASPDQQGFSSLAPHMDTHSLAFAKLTPKAVVKKLDQFIVRY